MTISKMYGTAVKIFQKQTCLAPEAIIHYDVFNYGGEINGS